MCEAIKSIDGGILEGVSNVSNKIFHRFISKHRKCVTVSLISKENLHFHANKEYYLGKHYSGYIFFVYPDFMNHC